MKKIIILLFFICDISNAKSLVYRHGYITPSARYYKDHLCINRCGCTQAYSCQPCCQIKRYPVVKFTTTYWDPLGYRIIYAPVVIEAVDY